MALAGGTYCLALGYSATDLSAPLLVQRDAYRFSDRPVTRCPLHAKGART